MNGLLAQVTIPYPDAVPVAAPHLLVWGLLLLTFVLHLIPMNLVLGGTFLSAMLRMGFGKGDESHRREVLKWASKWMPVAVAMAITFGVAPLLFLQVLYGRLLYTSSILVGGYWLSVIALLILAYYGTYLLAFKEGSLGRFTTPVSLGVSLLFIGIGFIYSNNMSQMLRPGSFLQRYRDDPVGLTLNLADSTLIPRYLHVFLGAVAVAGLVLMLYGLVRHGQERELARWAIRKGGMWFSLATVTNYIVGTWFLLSFPWTVLKALMRENVLGVVTMTAGIVLGLVALGLAILAMQAENPAPLIIGCLMTVLGTLVSMILTRDQIRDAAIGGVYKLSEWVVPQWGAIALFLVALIGGLSLSTWMVVRLARSWQS